MSSRKGPQDTCEQGKQARSFEGQTSLHKMASGEATTHLGDTDRPPARVLTKAVPALLTALNKDSSEREKSPGEKRGGEKGAGYVPGKAGVVCPRGGKGDCCMANWWSLVKSGCGMAYCPWIV